MNVLIYGAGNSIALYLARYLHRNGHAAILADTDRFARGFYSRYCRGEYLFREPAVDREGFVADVTSCISKEDIRLIVPTTDQAMLDMLRAEINLRGNVSSTFPFDYQKINYVMDKRNIYAICEKAGVNTVATRIADKEMAPQDVKKGCVETLAPPYALKPARGQKGTGFMKVAHREEMIRALKRMDAEQPGVPYLVQHYHEGEIYGAGALFVENSLKHFYAYKYIRRHPALYGPSTICQVALNDKIEEAMGKVLAALAWNGYCHMDFIIDERGCTPLLIDINPVHWYSVPNAQAKEFNSLSYYLEEGRGKQHETSSEEGRYVTTVLLCRELQRIASGMISPRQDSPSDGYWKYYRGLQCADFYWDPLPIVLAPFLKLFRSCAE